MIELAGITVDYGSAHAALDDVSLTFADQRLTVLLGPSGAGKSSLLRILNGLVKPRAGRVLVDGEEPAEGPKLKAHRRRTAMVFQQHHLLPRSTALDNVLVGRLAHLSRWHAVVPVPRRERLLALAALDRVGLADKALYRADRLSGGEQQRVGIARALVQEPRILLADEPVASLDPATASYIMGLIARIAREDGLTTIVSLHQVDLAVRHGDRVVGLNQGRVVYNGLPDGLDETDLARIYRGAAAIRDLVPVTNETRNEAATEAGNLARAGVVLSSAAEKR